MKRILFAAIATVMIFSLVLTGCAAQPTTSPTASETTSPAASPAESPSASAPSTAGGVKTGIGHDVSIAKSAGITTDKDGKQVDALAQTDAIMAAVTLDAEGKIVNVKIDNAQIKINFDEKGNLKTDVKAELKTKVELGDAYGMKKASSLGKEWYQEITALEDWMTGKTIDQIMAMKTTKKDDAHPAVPAEADLTSSVTLSVEGYLAAVKQAVENAQDFGTQAKGKTRTGLGHVVSIAKSAGATVDKDNKPVNALGQSDTVMAAVTIDEDNKIVGVMIDNAQIKVNFDAAGALVTDAKTEQKTKVELGDAYGMKKASSLGKEWYQQIDTLGKWMIGKTIDQVKAMKTTVKDEAHPAVPAEADLTSSVTLSVQDYIAAVAEAIANAD